MKETQITIRLLFFTCQAGKVTQWVGKDTEKSHLSYKNK